MTHATPSDHDRLLDLAHRYASVLHEHAVDDFWDARGAQAARALRAAQRLAHRLGRHDRARTQLEG